MKAKVYRVEIHDSITDWNHGFGRMICEIYIPELNISYNSEACFETDSKNRYKGEHAKCIGEIEVPDKIVQTLKSYIRANQKLFKVEDWFDKQEFKTKFNKYQERKRSEMLRDFSGDRQEHLKKELRKKKTKKKTKKKKLTSK